MSSKTNKNHEVKLLLDTYVFRFQRKTSDLYNNIYAYSHFDKQDQKGKSACNYLFRTWLEKFKENQEKDYYLKPIYQKRYCNDPLTFDETVKQFNYFNQDDWPMVLTG